MNSVRHSGVVIFVVNRAKVKVSLQGTDAVFDFTDNIVSYSNKLFARFQ